MHPTLRPPERWTREVLFDLLAQQTRERCCVGGIPFVQHCRQAIRDGPVKLSKCLIGNTSEFVMSLPPFVDHANRLANRAVATVAAGFAVVPAPDPKIR